ncbi:MAG: hypothetical protein RLZZ623_2696 [Actinomycetota bacterium]
MGQTGIVLERLRPKSTLGRAVLPVAGGLLFFALLGLVTWGIAAVLSNNPQRVNDRLAPQTFEVGNTESLAGLIADDGPLLFQGLIGSDANRSLVLDHTGDVVDKGWRIRYAYPADRDESCKVTQVRHTSEFTDCEGRSLTVEELARPAEIKPIVGNTVIIDLRVANAVPATPTTSTSTTSPATTG